MFTSTVAYQNHHKVDEITMSVCHDLKGQKEIFLMRRNGKVAFPDPSSLEIKNDLILVNAGHDDEVGDEEADLETILQNFFFSSTLRQNKLERFSDNFVTFISSGMDHIKYLLLGYS